MRRRTMSSLAWFVVVMLLAVSVPVESRERAISIGSG